MYCDCNGRTALQCAVRIEDYNEAYTVLRGFSNCGAAYMLVKARRPAALVQHVHYGRTKRPALCNSGRCFMWM